MTSNNNEYGEEAYLALVRDCIDNGHVRAGRNGAKTRSLFGKTLRFKLDEEQRIPLLTTKKVFFRGVIEELLWFIRGSTDTNELSRKQVKIWDAHASKSHLDSVGLGHYREGDIGPMYGFQLRHSGAEYKGMHCDYRGQGVDQLSRLIQGLRNDRASRRHVVSFWNPQDLHKMSLSPCHCTFQMYLDESNNLSCLLFQRSADIGLGLPFNIASYAVLTRLIASCINARAHEFIHVIGDAHIYEEHVEPLRKQIARTPLEFPTLRFKRKPTSINDLECMKFEDFIIENYQYHDKVSMPLIP